MSEHTRPFSRRAFVGGAAAFGISLCLPPLMPAKAHAVTAAEKQAEANAALEKLNAMQEKLDRAEVSLYAAETERDDAQARMDEAQGRIDSASSRISELQDKLGNRAFFLLYIETLGHHMLDEEAHLSPKVWKPSLTHDFFRPRTARIPARMG